MISGILFYSDAFVVCCFAGEKIVRPTNWGKLHGGAVTRLTESRLADFFHHHHLRLFEMNFSLYQRGEKAQLE
jgi:hypothetical protein